MSQNTKKKQKMKFDKKTAKGMADIIFADAKQSVERLVSLFSALFWTFLEFTFLKVFIMFIFTFAAYVTTGDIAYSYNVFNDNKDGLKTLLLAYLVFVFIMRLPVHYGRDIKE